VFFAKELICTLLEIAAQLAELNEQGIGAQEILRIWARAKGFIR